MQSAETISILADDGFELGAIAQNAERGRSLGGIVVLHEIFGLTPYIENVVGFLAAAGFDVVSPGLFDRQQPGAVISYDHPKEGLAFADRATEDALRLDISAALEKLRQRNERVGVMGICWGGGLAYWASATMAFDAAVVVYGTRLLQHKNRSPKCPVQFHFAEHDKHGTMDVRETMMRAAPDAAFEIYDADHGFDRKDATEKDRAVRDALRENICVFLKDALTR